MQPDPVLELQVLVLADLSPRPGEPCQSPSRLLPFVSRAGSGSPSGPSSEARCGISAAAPASGRPSLLLGSAAPKRGLPLSSRWTVRWLARLRWRQRGAWLWPTFVVAHRGRRGIVHTLPDGRRHQTLAGGIMVALVFNVIARAVLLSRPLGVLLRRRRTDMPAAVARNYGGTAAVLVCRAVMLAPASLHHSTIEPTSSAPA